MASNLADNGFSPIELFSFSPSGAGALSSVVSLKKWTAADGNRAIARTVEILRS